MNEIVSIQLNENVGIGILPTALCGETGIIPILQAIELNGFMKRFSPAGSVSGG